jgi:GTPase
MAFVDEVTISAHAGNGGNGIVHWLHLKGNAKGGPDGGDGGKGGDVILEAVRDLAALSRYRYEKAFTAVHGEAGRGELQTGAAGADLVLQVPVGTTALVAETGALHELVEEGQRIVLFAGGAGGKGNARFKSSTNQNPFQQTDGKPGVGGDVLLSLRLIADAGLIGLPSAGKSSLLNALTNAKSKVGAYPFTTLEPHLGDFYGHILADIPGLIEGASGGRGLGIKFLKHIERTGILLHLVSVDQDDPIAAYREVRSEVEAFGHGLAEKKEVIILSKIDLVNPGERETRRELLTRETGREVLEVSVEDPETLKAFSDRLSRLLSRREAVGGKQ